MIKIDKTKLNLRDAGGNSLGLWGIFSMQINVLGKSIAHDVWVCEKINDLILGSDFILKHNLAFDTVKRSYFWQTAPASSVISLTEETHFPALSTKIIKTKFNGTVQNFESQIMTIFCQDSKFLTGGPALVNITNDGFCTVAVTNCAPYDVFVQRGSIIGLIETEDADSNITEVSKDTVKNIINAMSDKQAEMDSISKPKNLTEEQISAKVNLKVPVQFHKRYIALLYKYRQAISVSKFDLGRSNNFSHKIHLKDNKPVYRKQFKIPEAHADFIEETVTEWLKLGVVRRSSSMYNSPIFCVPKKNGAGLRIVQDFRELNNHSHIDKYSMKEINECIGDIGRAGSTIFSTLDLTSGFWQMPMHPQHAHLTAFTLPSKGQFEWITSPMGLLGCPASFQRLMEKVMEGLNKVIVYIDDLLIHTDNHEDHLIELENVLQRLVENGLKLNLDKCVFGNQEVNYLGFTLTPDGITPGKDKMKSIKNAKPPTDVKMIRSFIGLCNFFRTHIKNFSKMSAPLTRLTRNDSTYKGGELPKDAMTAFLQLQLALTSDPVVAYPRNDRKYALIVDASTGNASTDGGLGAILAQVDERGLFHVISYGSRQLQKHEKNYSPYLLEMAAAVWGMDFYNEYLRGKQFVLYTDHKPLEKLGHLHTKTLNRLQLAMLEYDFVIQYKKGVTMPADFLSRTRIEEICAIDPFGPDCERLQSQDPDIIKLKHFHTKGFWPVDTSKRDIQRISPMLSRFFVQDNLIWIRLNDYERQRTALFLPARYRKRAMCEGHGSVLSGHDAMLKTYIRISDSYFWPGMKRHIEEHIRTCVQCQVRKSSHTKRVPLKPLPLLDQPNQRIHVDLFGPLKVSGKQNKYILCMTDAFTKYAEVCAIPNKEAATVADEIFKNWICRFGSPIQIHSDGGKEFVNKLSEEMFEIFHIKHTKTSPAHPQCNAQVEVFNKTVAKYLASFVDNTTLDWEQYIPALMFSYNTSYHSTIMTTPFELLFGLRPRTPTLPGQDTQRLHYGESFASERLQMLQKARQVAKLNTEEKTADYKKHYDKKAEVHKFKVHDMVYYSETDFLGRNRKLSPKWLGPVEIVKLTDTNATIKTKKNKLKILHLLRIKPFHFVRPNPEFDYMSDDEDFEDEVNKPTPNDVLLEPPCRPQTRALTRLLAERHTINFVSDDLKTKLTAICIKLYSQNLSISQLTPEEAELWQSFELGDIVFFLTGQRERTPDYTHYLKSCAGHQAAQPAQQLPVGPAQPFQPHQHPPNLLVNLPPRLGTPALTPPLTPANGHVIPAFPAAQPQPPAAVERRTTRSQTGNSCPRNFGPDYVQTVQNIALWA